jgi:hypothetical protein
VVVLWLGCRFCHTSVNTICGRIMIGLSLYCVYWRTTTTVNPIIIRPHCMFTDTRQQRQPNHNTITYCVYGRTKITINTIIIRPHNTICGRIMIGLSLLSSVSKHTMWSYYYWVYCCCRPSVNILCGRTMIGLSLLSSVSKHNMRSYYDWDHNTTTYCVYWRTTTTTT